MSELNTSHRCDYCGVQAYVETTIDNGLPLAWCGHHYRENESALEPYVIAINDQRHLLKA